MTVATLHFDKHLTAARVREVAAYVAETYASDMDGCAVAHNEITLTVHRGSLKALLRKLRDDKKTAFKILVDLCGADYPEREERFEVVYHLLSPAQNMRLRVKVAVGEGSTVPSVIDVFSAANWYEREAYDMYGIAFEGHPDLRRILTDYGFDGHPLRKDFPLVGYTEVYYDVKEQRVAYKPVDLPQETRFFDAVSAWEGVGHNKNRATQDSVFDMDEFAGDTAAAPAAQSGQK